MLTDQHATLLQKVNASALLRTLGRAALTFVTVTPISERNACAFVNYNTNRGPYSIRVIPDYDISTGSWLPAFQRSPT